MPDKLGRRLKQAREHRKLTQEGLADAVKGASQAAISALERRNSETTILLFGLADALEVNPRWLLNGPPEDSWLDKRPDPLQGQLNEIYSQLDQDRRDALLGRANALLAEQKPGGVHDPYPKARKPVKAR